MHIVIIDADRTLREQVKRTCKKRGFTTAAVASAQDGIAACEERAPDVIVLELQLRAHSGVEFIHELRSYPEWSTIPIVLYTLVPQSVLSHFRDSFSQLGIKGYVYKPTGTFHKLLNSIEDAALTAR